MNAVLGHRRAGDGPGLRLAVLIIAAVAFAGCASETWSKPGVAADQQEADERRCTREFLTPGAGGAVRNYAVDPDCMRKLGYKLE